MNRHIFLVTGQNTRNNTLQELETKFQILCDTFDCIKGKNYHSQGNQVIILFPEYYLSSKLASDRYVPKQTWETFKTKIRTLTSHAPNIYLIPGTFNYQKEIMRPMRKSYTLVSDRLDVLKTLWINNVPIDDNSWNQYMQHFTALKDELEEYHKNLKAKLNKINHSNKGKYLHSNRGLDYAERYKTLRTSNFTNMNHQNFTSKIQYSQNDYDNAVLQHLNDETKNVGQNTALVVHNGQIIHRYNKINDFHESDPNHSKVMYLPGGKRLVNHNNTGDQFNIDGSSYSMEICMDHACNHQHKLIQNNVPAASSHIILSDSVSTNLTQWLSNFIIHCSTNRNETGVYEWDTYAKKYVKHAPFSEGALSKLVKNADEHIFHYKL